MNGGEVDGFVPTDEVIEWARGPVESLVAKLRRWQSEAEAKGDDVRAREHRWAVHIIERNLLGDGTGCVVTGFDRRRPELDRIWREAGR